MAGSWHVGKIAGIDVRIHWTFLLLPLYIYFSSLFAGSGAVAATLAVVFVLAIFACVVLHELGHALTARQFGIPTQDITLLPIGGLARLQSIPRNPWQELAIAIAGPAVNVVIAILIFAGLNSSLFALPSAAPVTQFLSQLAWVNIALVIFNMLPAFPMDGGRVLRAALALALPYAKATSIAATVGQVVAVGLALLGLMSSNLMLVFLAGFVFLAARAESNLVSRQQRAESSPLQGEWSFESPRRIETEGVALPIINASWNARSALSWLSADAIDEFLVAIDGKVIGVARKHDLQSLVQAGHGALAIGRLLAMRFLPLRPVQPNGFA